MSDFKNKSIVLTAVNESDIIYHTWVYRAANDLDENEKWNTACFWDIILTSDKLVVAGEDILTNHPYKHISDYGIYFGSSSGTYDENYLNCGGHWRFADGNEIGFFMTAGGNKEWTICFASSRKDEAMEFYKKFNELYMKNLNG